MHNQLYAKAEKCKFSVTRTEFLGFDISADGVAVESRFLAFLALRRVCVRECASIDSKSIGLYYLRIPRI